MYHFYLLFQLCCFLTTVNCIDIELYIILFYRYPTSDMYEDVIDGIMREYPHLLSTGGLPASSARVSKLIFYGCPQFQNIAIL